MRAAQTKTVSYSLRMNTSSLTATGCCGPFMACAHSGVESSVRRTTRSPSRRKRSAAENPSLHGFVGTSYDVVVEAIAPTTKVIGAAAEPQNQGD